MSSVQKQKIIVQRLVVYLQKTMILVSSVHSPVFIACFCIRIIGLADSMMLYSVLKYPGGSPSLPSGLALTKDKALEALRRNLNLPYSTVRALGDN